MTRPGKRAVTSFQYWRVIVDDVQGGAGTYPASFGNVEFRGSVGGADLATGGTAIAGPTNGSYPATNAFDANTATFWLGSGTVSGGNQWIGYNFGTPVQILDVALQVRPDAFGANEAVIAGRVQSSTDGVTWVTEWSFTTANSWVNNSTEQRSYPRTIAVGDAPVVESANFAASSTAGLTSDAVDSGSPADGELVILHIAYGDAIADATDFVWPSGFTQGDRRSFGRSNHAWAWKVAASEPSTYTVTWSAGSTRTVLTAIVVSGHDGIDGSTSANTQSNTNDVPFVAYGQIEAASLRLLLMAFGWGGAPTTITPPTLDPPIVLLHGPTATAGDNNTGCGVVVQARTEVLREYVAFTNTITWSSNAAGVHNSRFQIAIKPIPPP